jgi:hypothetical protein
MCSSHYVNICKTAEPVTDVNFATAAFQEVYLRGYSILIHKPV